jgi:hypothetical protein
MVEVGWVGERLGRLIERLGPLFARPEPLRQAEKTAPATSSAGKPVLANGSARRVNKPTKFLRYITDPTGQQTPDCGLLHQGSGLRLDRRHYKDPQVGDEPDQP